MQQFNPFSSSLKCVLSQSEVGQFRLMLHPSWLTRFKLVLLAHAFPAGYYLSQPAVPGCPRLPHSPHSYYCSPRLRTHPFPTLRVLPRAAWAGARVIIEMFTNIWKHSRHAPHVMWTWHDQTWNGRGLWRGLWREQGRRLGRGLGRELGIKGAGKGAG